MKLNWVAIGAVGTLLGGVAAVAALVMSRQIPHQTSEAATAFYADGCEQRLRAIQARATLRNAQGQPALNLETSADWCRCTGAVLETHFDASTVRGVGEWFQAVALGGAERSAEEEYFSQFSAAERTRLESAYDFASRQCNRR